MTTIFILSQGEGSRVKDLIGSYPKSFLKLGDEYLFQWQLKMLRPIINKRFVIIINNNHSLPIHLKLDKNVVIERVKKTEDMIGTVKLIDELRTDHNIIINCDVLLDFKYVHMYYGDTIYKYNGFLCSSYSLKNVSEGKIFYHDLKSNGRLNNILNQDNIGLIPAQHVGFSFFLEDFSLRYSDNVNLKDPWNLSFLKNNIGNNYCDVYPLYLDFWWADFGTEKGVEYFYERQVEIRKILS